MDFAPPPFERHNNNRSSKVTMQYSGFLFRKESELLNFRTAKPNDSKILANSIFNELQICKRVRPFMELKYF